MTDEELQAIRGIMKNLRNGTADLVGTVESANLIESLLDEIDRLKKEYYGWDAETKAGFWRQADSIRKYQQEIDQLKAEIECLKKRLTARDQKIEANAELAQEIYQLAQASLDRLKENLPDQRTRKP